MGALGEEDGDRSQRVSEDLLREEGVSNCLEIQRGKLVILIIGIGKRERAEIYREVAQRLRRLTDDLLGPLFWERLVSRASGVARPGRAGYPRIRS